MADDPGNPEYRDFQAAVLQSWGGILLTLGRSPEAEAILRQAVTIDEGLVRDFPQVPMYQISTGQCTRQSWQCAGLSGKSEESEQVQRRSLEILEKLAAEYPEVPDYRSAVGGGLNNIAAVLMDRGNWEEARQLLEQAIVHQKAALEINPEENTTNIPERTPGELDAVQLALGDQRQPHARQKPMRITSIRWSECPFTAMSGRRVHWRDLDRECGRHSGPDCLIRSDGSSTGRVFC